MASVAGSCGLIPHGGLAGKGPGLVLLSQDSLAGNCRVSRVWSLCYCCLWEHEAKDPVGWVVVVVVGNPTLTRLVWCVLYLTWHLCGCYP